MYKGVYCALCKRMGREYGVLSRMTLNYDFAFLAMLGLAVEEGCAGFERQRCLFNPLKKCLCCKGGEAFSFAAAASMVMLYYKLKDNVTDQTFLKSIPARFCARHHRYGDRRNRRYLCDLHNQLPGYPWCIRRILKDKKTYLGYHAP